MTTAADPDGRLRARPAVPSPADWPGILALLRRADLPTDDLDVARLDRFLVIRGADRVVGCVAVESYGGAGLLRSLAVALEARGQGLGVHLVDAAEARARADGLGALYLLTTTAAPFFEARGYAPVGRAEVPEPVRQSAEFASVCPAAAACLGKLL